MQCGSNATLLLFQKHPFANLSRTSNNDKRYRGGAGGLLRGGLGVVDNPVDKTVLL